MTIAVTVPSSTALRLKVLASRIHQLGERPLYEAMRELVAGADPLTVFETYGALPADLIAAYGGDRFSSNVILLRRASS